MDPETGEPVVAFDVGCRRHETLCIATCDEVPATSALIDAVTFSVVPPDEKSYVWVMAQMQQFLDIQGFQQRKGMFGFRYSARFGDGVGIVAWGGESQRWHVFFSLMGKGCSMVQDWHALAVWLEGIHDFRCHDLRHTFATWHRDADPSMNCNAWASGRHKRWLRGMVTLRRKVCNSRQVGSIP
ncbi:MAG: hypothetical protein ABI434_22925 [Burkholderiaceae bacterium]